MIQHIVALSLVPNHDAVELEAVMTGLSELKIDGFMSFSHGENLDFEQKSQAYQYGFICTFRDAEALTCYAENGSHRKLGARLVALCIGGGDGIFVMDIQV